MDEIKITGLTLKDYPEARGERTRALFSVEARGVEIRNCSLIERCGRQKFITKPPRVTEKGSGERNVRFLDHDLAAAITGAAAKVFFQFGGEWTPGEKAEAEIGPITLKVLQH